MRYLKISCLVLFAALVLIAAAGCGSSGGDSSSTSGNKRDSTAVEDSTPSIEKVGGDAQEVPIGTAASEPLEVKVTDGNGKALAGEEVYFYVQNGAADFNGNSRVYVTTGSDGTASANLTVDVGLAGITVKAAHTGAGLVSFNITPRLPTLGEVAYGSNSDLIINELPAILAEVEGAGRTLVLLTGNSGLDLAGLPVAGDLSGTLVGSVQAEDLPVALMPAEKLLDSSSFSPPAAGSLTGSFIAGNKAENMPAVLPDYKVNSTSVVMLVKGDASSISEAMPLSELLAANSTASDLTVRAIEASDYPDIQIASADYIAMDDATLPVFSGSEDVTGVSGMSVPVAGVTLPSANLSLVELDGSLTAAVKTEPDEKPMKMYAPEGSIIAIPPEYSDVVSVVQNEIIPLSQSVRPIMEEQRALMEDLGQTLQDNMGVISDLLNGNITDPFQLAGIAGEVLPTVDRMLQNQLEMMPIQAEQLDIIRNQLIPSLENALEGNDITFGGTTDGEPTSVLNDVLPFIDGELALLQDSMPMIEKLVADIESLIPDNGNLLELMGNLTSGAVDEILADLDALMPNLVSGLQLFNDDGIPILYDLLEQAEADIQAGDMQVSDTRVFDAVVGWMSSELSQDATLGELPGFDMWGDMVADYIPPEWGDPAGVSIFDDIVPAIGSMDISEDVLPVLRDGLDAVATALPGVISALEGFSFLDINMSFGL